MTNMILVNQNLSPRDLLSSVDFLRNSFVRSRNMSQERKTSPMLLSRVLILFASAQFRKTRTDTPKRS